MSRRSGPRERFVIVCSSRHILQASPRRHRVRVGFAGRIAASARATHQRQPIRTCRRSGSYRCRWCVVAQRLWRDADAYPRSPLTRPTEKRIPPCVSVSQRLRDEDRTPLEHTSGVMREPLTPGARRYRVMKSALAAKEDNTRPTSARGRTDRVNHGNRAYSARASLMTGISGSAFFHSVKRSL